MKVAIVGSRSFNNYDMLYEEIMKSVNISKITEIISGGANGADKLAEKFAIHKNIKMSIFKPDWSLGRVAGMIRNKTIVENADVVFAFWDGSSKGTKNSIDHAKRMKKRLFIIEYSSDDLLTVDPKKYIVNYFSKNDL